MAAGKVERGRGSATCPGRGVHGERTEHHASEKPPAARRRDLLPVLASTGRSKEAGTRRITPILTETNALRGWERRVSHASVVQCRRTGSLFAAKTVDRKRACKCSGKQASDEPGQFTVSRASGPFVPAFETGCRHVVPCGPRQHNTGDSERATLDARVETQVTPKRWNRDAAKGLDLTWCGGAGAKGLRTFGRLALTVGVWNRA